jgi:hypothetical protein
MAGKTTHEERARSEQEARLASAVATPTEHVPRLVTSHDVRARMHSLAQGMVSRLKLGRRDVTD